MMSWTYKSPGLIAFKRRQYDIGFGVQNNFYVSYFTLR